MILITNYKTRDSFHLKFFKASFVISLLLHSFSTCKAFEGSTSTIAINILYLPITAALYFLHSQGGLLWLVVIHSNLLCNLLPKIYSKLPYGPLIYLRKFANIGKACIYFIIIAHFINQLFVLE